MLEAARQAIAIAPQSMVAGFMCVEAETMAGETAAARVRLAELKQRHSNAPVALRRAAETYTQLGAHTPLRPIAARRPPAHCVLTTSTDCFRRRLVLAMGRLDEAEADLDELIARRPSDFDAYYNRATLRKQTPQTESRCCDGKQRSQL